MTPINVLTRPSAAVLRSSETDGIRDLPPIGIMALEEEVAETHKLVDILEAKVRRLAGSQASVRP